MNRMRPMPNAELDPDLRRRLAAALDTVQPHYSMPRYALIRPRSLAWRLAPAAIAAVALSALVVSAYAGSGSPNPAEWTKTVVNVVAPAATSSTPEPSQPPMHQPAPTPTQQQRQSPEPRESPDPTESNDSRESSSDSGDSER